MQIDVHGYHPVDIVWSGVFAKLVEQAWEMGGGGERERDSGALGVLRLQPIFTLREQSGPI